MRDEAFYGRRRSVAPTGYQHLTGAAVGIRGVAVQRLADYGDCLRRALETTIPHGNAGTGGYPGFVPGRLLRPCSQW